MVVLGASASQGPKDGILGILIGDQLLETILN